MTPEEAVKIIRRNRRLLFRKHKDGWVWKFRGARWWTYASDAQIVAAVPTFMKIWEKQRQHGPIS